MFNRKEKKTVGDDDNNVSKFRQMKKKTKKKLAVLKRWGNKFKIEGAHTIGKMMMKKKKRKGKQIH